jgi:hypothetical protein
MQQQQQHSCYSGMLLEQVNLSSTTTRGAWNLGEKTKLNSCTNVAVLKFPSTIDHSSYIKWWIQILGSEYDQEDHSNTWEKSKVQLFEWQGDIIGHILL